MAPSMKDEDALDVFGIGMEEGEADDEDGSKRSPGERTIKNEVDG